ncbi:enterochelin esterase domain-containing protein [Corynebacterium confusum]|uniref:enterochelin esterase domain-containing protein n=1 Tax=uncultured Corynebacterium sp. TaxID=159447 RepID=UPI0025E64880|nr:enterochelin esterase domain-containing protein [uncultured Corynebacterium sp.]
MTFLYHAESAPQAVHLNINRITDKSDFEVGLMCRVSGTHWWIRTLELAPMVYASYGFCEYAEARPAPRGLLPASL